MEGLPYPVALWVSDGTGHGTVLGAEFGARFPRRTLSIHADLDSLLLVIVLGTGATCASAEDAVLDPARNFLDLFHADGGIEDAERRAPTQGLVRAAQPSRRLLPVTERLGRGKIKGCVNGERAV